MEKKNAKAKQGALFRWAPVGGAPAAAVPASAPDDNAVHGVRVLPVMGWNALVFSSDAVFLFLW